MKKLFSLLCLLVMCSVFCLAPFGMSYVSAKETSEESDENKDIPPPDIVYKMVLNTADNATYQVHQYYRKSGLDGFSKASGYVYSNISAKNVVEQPLGNGGLAALYINKNGDVILGTANDVKIVNLRFFFLIANSTNDSAAFCGNQYKLCENARTVRVNQNGFTHWKTEAKINSLYYTESQIKTEFNIKTDNVGKSAYTGYNLFDSIGNVYTDIAKKSGIYVIASMVVSTSLHGQVRETSINEYTVDSQEFKFNEVADADEDNTNNKITFDTFTSVNSVRSNSGAHSVTNLEELAALIAPVDTSGDDIKKSEAIFKLQQFWETTLKPVLIFGIGILFVVVGASTGVTIIKSSDEPEVRKEAIKKLVGLFIGALLIELLLIFSADIVEIVSSFIE